MGKSIACRDVGLDCDFKARAENDEALLRQVKEHARTKHNIQEISPELASKVRGAIRDER